MPSEKELYTEWVAAQKDKLKVLDSWQDLKDWQKTVLGIQSVKPYFYYKQEAVEKHEDAALHKDRAQPAPWTPSPSGSSPLPSSAPPAAAGQTTIQGAPPAAKPKTARVSVPGSDSTRPFARWINQSAGLRWSRDRMAFEGDVPVEKLPDLEKEFAKRGLQFTVG